MKAVKKQIVIDCERMKYAHTGLYHYCFQLSKALIDIADPARESLNFYLPGTLNGIFDPASAGYLAHHSYHKLFPPLVGRYDLWHGTYQGTRYFPGSSKLKKVLTVHDINFMHDEKKNASKQKRYLARLQQNINRADHIVAISRFVLDDLAKYMDLGKKPATIIYNGCNIAELTGLSPAPKTKPVSPFIFTIGTVVDKKNFHVLPALLVGNDWQLVIAGIIQREDYRQEIIAEAKRLDVADRLVFTGPVSEADKHWYYHHCEAFVFPSLAEGFGLPVVEAMHYGKPVFLSDRTCLPEIGGTAAYYFTTFEPAAMRSVFEKGLADYHNHPGKTAEIKARAAKFKWPEAAAAYLEVYRSLYD